jgi:predicted metalloprotease with PDZ domain
MAALRRILRVLPLTWLAQVHATQTPAIPSPQDVPFPGIVTLKVDATDTTRRIYRMKETVPASPGPLTLLYPQWIPGNHSPTGPVPALAGLVATAQGRRVEWRRDPLNMYAFHLEVPPGATAVDLEFQFLTPQSESQGRVVMLPQLLGLQWNTVVLYPAGYTSKRIKIQASLTLPAGWGFGSALDVAHREGNSIEFAPTTLETLLDSPLFAGENFKRVLLDPTPQAPVNLNIVADSAEQLVMSPAALAAYSQLPREAYAAFGSRHYDHYEFLLALSEHFSDIGLEHHRSSENRHQPTLFTAWDRSAPGRDLLAHEFVHSWNGKFRRPAGLATANYEVPMQNALLWVYEGMTEYWGNVLAARSGLWSAEDARAAWAEIAAMLDKARPGREWRDLSDSTNQPIIAYKKRQPWYTWQRSTDYYGEGALIWLDVDTRIRELTRERRSLDDFAKAFLSTQDGDRGPLSYTFEDIVAALDGVAPNDWASFLNERIHSHGPGAPLEGLRRGGWQVVYGEQMPPYLKNAEDADGNVNLIYSIGVLASRDGELSEVRWGSPAYAAGLTQGTRLIAVDGMEYSGDRLKQAIRTARGGSKAIELIVRNLDRYRTVVINWSQGLLYPQLQRLPGTPDRFSAIMKPRATPMR